MTQPPSLLTRLSPHRSDRSDPHRGRAKS